MNIRIQQVDFSQAQQVQELAKQLIAYSADPMGGGEALAEDIALNNIQAFGAQSYTFSFLAYDDTQAIGMCNCIESFSTFAGRALVNIHDISVIPEYQGRGIGKRLLQAVEDAARERAAVKITLEVLEGNDRAQKAYKAFGFAPYTLDPEAGFAQFWQKALS